MKTMRVHSGCNERSFGHCLVNWEIKNYSSVVWKEYNEVESPRFAVHGPKSMVTNWKLILRHDSRVESSSNVPSRPKSLPEFESAKVETSTQKNSRFFFYLVRCDSGQDTLWVDWRVSCSRMGDERNTAIGGKSYFDVACRQEINLGTVFDFEREFQCNDSLTFECQMMVQMKERHFTGSFDSSVDMDLSNLSEDLLSMLKQSEFFDLELRYAEKRVNVHKAIIYSRCKNFIDLATKKVCNAVCMPPEEYEGMMKILDYIYSGDPTRIVSSPSIAIYDSILLMKLTELKELFTPEEHTLLTKFAAEVLTYVWPIHDFSKRDEHCLSSPILTNDMDISWQIHLFPRGVTNQSDNISVSVENTEGKVWDELCIQCAVLREDKNLELWKDFQKSTEAEYLFKNDSFMNREELIESLDDDLLRLGFIVTMSAGKIHSILGCSTNNYAGLSQLKPLEKLSDDIASLLQDDLYTDVILRAEDGEMKAHKCILCSRSRVLAIMPEMETNHLVLSDIKLVILKVVIDYMYSARLKVSDVVTLLDVYEVAEKFAISVLREKCSRILQESLTLENACDILNLADDYDDNLLKQKSIEFMQLNISDIRKQELWEELKLKKPTLCSEIDRSLSQPKKGTVEDAAGENGKKIKLIQEELERMRMKEVEEEGDSIPAAVVEKEGDSIPPAEVERESGSTRTEEVERESDSARTEGVGKESDSFEANINNNTIKQTAKVSNDVIVPTNDHKGQETLAESGDRKIEIAEATNGASKACDRLNPTQKT